MTTPLRADRPPMTPAAVEQAIADCIGRIESGVATVAELDAKATRLRREFDTAYALAFVRAEGAMDIRKYLAVGQTEKAREAAEDAEVGLRHARSLLAALRDSLDAYRSISASVRASFGAS